jgi:hypothetical protein
MMEKRYSIDNNTTPLEEVNYKRYYLCEFGQTGKTIGEQDDRLGEQRKSAGTRRPGRRHWW